MRISEIRALSPQELEVKLEQAREEFYKLRFRFKIGQLTDTSRFKIIRHDIARLETVRRERQIAAELARVQQKEG